MRIEQPIDRLYLDLETRSPLPLDKVGSYRYAEDCEILLVAYALDDAPVEVVSFDAEHVGDFINELIARANRVIIHNAMFDRIVLRAHGVIVPVEKIDDTAVIALINGLPASLDAAAKVLGLPGKMGEGKNLIKVFQRFAPHERPDDWAQFVEYARQDVETMRRLYAAMPRQAWERLRSEYVLDQAINDRGFAIDLELARACRELVEWAQDALADEVARLTDGRVTRATQRERILRELEGQGVSLPDLRAPTVEQALARGDLTPTARALLVARDAAGSSSVAKYAAALAAVCRDGRLHGALQYYGASRTGRYAGRIFQPQNLPRPTLSAKAINEGIERLIRRDSTLTPAEVLDYAKNALRGLIVAPEGRYLLVADLSAIEARIVAWLAGEKWVLDAFRHGRDLYIETYSRAFGVPADQVTKAQRQIGKIMVLALGYGGGVNAFARFAETYGMALPEGMAERAVSAWREANPKIRELWQALESGVRKALCAAFVGRPVRINDKLAALYDGRFLRLRLPSCRTLSYFGMTEEHGELVYQGQNQTTKNFEKTKTYGGKLAENVTQAVARDVLMNGIMLAERAGLSVVLSVHDEIIAESEDDDVSPLIRAMTTPPEWALDLPLNAEGFSTRRYAK